MPHAELLRLSVAEREAPWGEAARTLRARFLAAVLQGVSDGFEESGRRHALDRAAEMMDRLDG